MVLRIRHLLLLALMACVVPNIYAALNDSLEFYHDFSNSSNYYLDYSGHNRTANAWGTLSFAN